MEEPLAEGPSVEEPPYTKVSDRVYETRTTSGETTEVVHDIILEDEDYEDKLLTRKVLRLHWVDNKKDARRPVRGELLHQKRPNGVKTWENVLPPHLSRLKGGEAVAYDLGGRHMAKLREALNDTYAIWEAHGRPKWEETYTVRTLEPGESVEDERPARLEDIQNLAQEHGEAFWGLIGAISDDLPTAVAWQRIQQERARALAEFQEQLDRLEWDEKAWQVFFERNTWIFGYGLDYRFTHILNREAVVAGADYQGKDEERTDYLLATAGDARFTVVVDIKTPAADLIVHKPYRNRVYHESREVAGGVAQVQAYCRNWETEGAQNARNARTLDAQRIYTAEPRGILVIGRLASLQGSIDADKNPAPQADVDKRQCFEAYRRNLHNPDIITFDELLERARHIVGHEGP